MTFRVKSSGSDKETWIQNALAYKTHDSINQISHDIFPRKNDFKINTNIL
jgi:hypothetical protein